MTLQRAIKLLEIHYERAKGLAHIRNPLAYALYKVWKMADKEPPKEKAPTRNEDRCVCCGAIIPEGRQVCTKCQTIGNEGGVKKC